MSLKRVGQSKKVDKFRECHSVMLIESVFKYQERKTHPVCIIQGD